MLINDLIKNVYDNSLHFEQQYSINFRRRTGLYFTFNIKIIDILLKKLFSIKNNKKLLNQKILEPAVGAGTIIIRIIIRMLNRNISKNEIIQFLENNVYAFDINKDALKLYKENIKSIAYNLFGIHNIKLKLFNEDFTRAHLLKDEFNFVIGNPPFISFYGPKGAKKTESSREYYLSHYKFIPDTVQNGRLNSSMFFIERGLESLKNKGVLAYILDDSFLEPPFKDIRKFILDNSNIKDLYINLKSFKEVVSGQLILIIQKAKSFSEKNIIKVIGPTKSIDIPQIKWRNKSYEFKIIGIKSQKILQKISKYSNPLKYYFPKKSLRTNTMLLNMKDKFLTPDKVSALSMPYYEGSKSLKNPYGHLYYTSYFTYNTRLKNKINKRLQDRLIKRGVKNRKRIGLGNIHVYKSPKLYIRQSAKRIIATYSSQMDSSNNSLYSLSNIYDTESTTQFTKIKLLGTLAQLNSNIDNFFAIKSGIIRFNKGKQPQIRISKLKKIPLIKNKGIFQQLSKLVRGILNNENVNRNIRSINLILYKYYHLTKNEIDIINQY